VIGMPEGIRRLCVAYDVEGYSGRGTRREFAAQEQLAALLTFAFAETGLPQAAYEIQEQGDGGVAFLPTGGTIDEPRLIVRLIDALRMGLADLNADLVESARIRLRVGLQEGIVHQAPHGYVGPAVIAACRLRDAEPVRAALARSRAPFVIVAADGLYQDVLSQGYHGLSATAFAQVQVQVKSFEARAWVHLPASADRPGEPGLASLAPDGGRAPRSALEDILGAGPDIW
jgi:hypothetical protein